MTRPPMTPAEVVEALCEAQATAYTVDPCSPEWDRANAHRDAIKARLKDYIKAANAELNIPCDKAADIECDSPMCLAWRKLEEECRGE